MVKILLISTDEFVLPQVVKSLNAHTFGDVFLELANRREYLIGLGDTKKLIHTAVAHLSDVLIGQVADNADLTYRKMAAKTTLI